MDGRVAVVSPRDRRKRHKKTLMMQNRTCFLEPFYQYATQGVRSLAWPTYYPFTQVLTLGCNISGFPWRSERQQSQPCTFRSCGAESGPSAWCLRNPPQASGPPVLPTDRRQLTTCDSRADEISSFQPLLLGSHDEIIMPVHGSRGLGIRGQLLDWPGQGPVHSPGTITGNSG